MPEGLQLEGDPEVIGPRHPAFSEGLNRTKSRLALHDSRGESRYPRPHGAS